MSYTYPIVEEPWGRTGMSRIISIKRDLMTILGLVVLAICMLGLGMLSAAAVKEIQLMKDGKSEAVRWAKSLFDDPDDLTKDFKERKFFVDRNRSISRIFAYDIFDKDGNLFHSAGPSNWHPFGEISDLLNSPVNIYRPHGSSTIG